MRYAKSIIALLGASSATLIAALSDGPVSGAEWAGIVLALITGGAAYGVPNRDEGGKPGMHNLP